MSESTQPGSSPEIPQVTKKKRGPPRKFDDALAEYRSKYDGCSRGQLQAKNRALYNRLLLDGQLDQVPTVNRRIDNLVSFYHEHYEGLTRTELKEKDNSLYTMLRRDKLIHHVPRKKNIERGKKTPVRKIDDLLGYYCEHYADLTRGELAKADFSFYRRLLRAGLMEEIPESGE